ncbi:hypothetical protein FJT64_024820 [Amphibalanus amphitrite]|uniref:Uncharacterized protein n=1 Tax=Amphibalanus amphitrite TaxID=1232801 RepID=A0A6A4WHX9_AMPAM|nr:hypothetical protein FJT64_024820 [Amphibalanus amphitrite]
MAPQHHSIGAATVASCRRLQPLQQAAHDRSGPCIKAAGGEQRPADTADPVPATHLPETAVMKSVQLAVLAACLCAVSAGWLPEKMVKKFAMKKIYADCFGKEVMSSLREEMYAAHVKCSGHHPEALPAADAIVTGDDELSLVRRRRQARHFSPDKLEKMRTKITAFFGNATCVLRELKMLDKENNVDIDSMRERLSNMDIDETMKTELGQFMTDCHQFASCVPDHVLDKPGVLMGFGRQMTFFKCFKESKLEACMKKSFREDYLPMLVEENLPVDEDESFYTIITTAIIGEKKSFE